MHGLVNHEGISSKGRNETIPHLTDFREYPHPSGRDGSSRGEVLQGMTSWHAVEMILPAALEDPACAVLEELGSVGWEIRAGEPGFSSLLAYWADPVPPGLGGSISRRLKTLAEGLAAHPKALQRPIVVDEDSGNTVIGRPPENVLDLISK